MKAFIGIALDFDTEEVFISSLSESCKEAQAKLDDRRGYLEHRKVFQMSVDLAPELEEWFTACGMDRETAISNIHGIGTALQKVLASTNN